MRIVICGDTHGNIEKMKAELEQLPGVDYLIHTGDYYHDGLKLAQSLGIKARVVVGNCDIGVTGPREDIFTLAGHKFLLTHGHLYRVKSHLISLRLKAEEVGARVVIFGHSHQALKEDEKGILFINPGSSSHPRLHQQGTYAIVDVDEKNIEARIIQLKL